MWTFHGDFFLNRDYEGGFVALLYEHHPNVLKFVDVFDLHIYEAARSAETFTKSFRALEELMQAHAIRHLPVVQDTAVVGLVSLGDLYVMEAVAGVDPDLTEVWIRKNRHGPKGCVELTFAREKMSFIGRNVAATVAAETGKSPVHGK